MDGAQFELHSFRRPGKTYWAVTARAGAAFLVSASILLNAGYAGAHGVQTIQGQQAYPAIRQFPGSDVSAAPPPFEAVRSVASAAAIGPAYLMSPSGIGTSDPDGASSFLQSRTVPHENGAQGQFRTTAVVVAQNSNNTNSPDVSDPASSELVLDKVGEAFRQNVFLNAFAETSPELFKAFVRRAVAAMAWGESLVQKVSGRDDAGLSPEDEIAAALKRNPLLHAFAEAEPELFKTFVQRVVAVVDGGEDIADMAGAILPALQAAVAKRLAFAADGDVVEANRQTIALRQKLLRDDPETCVFVEDQGKGAQLRTDPSRYRDLMERQQVLQARVLRSVRPGSLPLVSEAEIAPLRDLVQSRLKTMYGEKLALFEKAKLSPGDYRDFCAISLSFLQEIDKLPRSDAVRFLRFIYSSYFR